MAKSYIKKKQKNKGCVEFAFLNWAPMNSIDQESDEKFEREMKS